MHECLNCTIGIPSALGVRVRVMVMVRVRVKLHNWHTFSVGG
jgi:hypothetical protein